MDNATYNQVASVIQNAPDMQGIEDPTAGVPGMPPQWGAPVLPQIITFQGLASTISRVYRPSDEAIKDSWDNARFMLNDVGIMECLQARQRSVALLDWTIEPEDTTSPDQKELATEVEKIIRRIPRFMQWLENNQHAIWFGRSLVQHRYRWGDVDGKMRVFPHEWYPVHGDKLAFRIDDGTHKYPHNQIGIRVGQTYKLDERIGIHNTVEPTDRGMAYFLTPDQRKSVALHKHYIMDGAFEDPLDADKINGVGIRSVIYWEWYQKQQALAWLMEYLERSAFGIELWFYPEGNPGAKEQWIEASKNRIGGGRNMLFVPRPTGSDGMNYGVERIEPGLQGADVLTGIIEKYYGHRIKRYILGQTLTSEADATGLGSGLAELHLGTFLDIIKYDATNLEETATNDLVKWVQLWNFPNSRGIRLYFKLKTDSVDKKERLDAIEKAWQMGARVKETDALDAAGLTVPNDEDRVLPAPGAGVQQAFGKLGDAMGKHQQSMEASLNESLGADDTGGTDDRIPPEKPADDNAAPEQYSAWKEGDHPRGQPENPGEFAPVNGSSPDADEAIEKARDFAKHAPRTRAQIKHELEDWGLESHLEDALKAIGHKEPEKQQEPVEREAEQAEVTASQGRATATEDKPHEQMTHDELMKEAWRRSIVVDRPTAPIKGGGVFYHVVPSSYEEGDDILSGAEYERSKGKKLKNKWADTPRYKETEDFQNVALAESFAEAYAFNHEHLKGRGKILRIRVPEVETLHRNEERYPTVSRKIPADWIEGVENGKKRK